MRFTPLAALAAAFLGVACGARPKDAAPPQCEATCVASSDCDFGEVCRQGCCELGCDTNADCAAGETCLSGQCKRRPSDAGTADGGLAADAGTRTDGGAAADGGTAGGKPVGSSCASAAECADGTCLNMPGGYCTKAECSGGRGCPTGSRCFTLPGYSVGSACFQTCTTATDCRTAEGYTCDSDSTCYRSASSGADGGAPADGGATAGLPVGSACTSASQCAGGTCLGYSGGYCTVSGCTTTTGCPEGTKCFSIQNGTQTACFKLCTSASECRTGEGYTCDSDSTCYPGSAPAPCSATNPTGACPAGQSCQGGTCAAYACTDAAQEPNDTLASAKAPPMETTDMAVCGASDKDWFLLPVPPSSIATVGALFDKSQGDLDLTAYTGAGQCLGGRYLHAYCSWSTRSYERNEELLSVLNGSATAAKNYAWKVEGYGGATNDYRLWGETIPWKDGRDCAEVDTLYPCSGRTSAGETRLIQFPFADPADPYAGDGYRFDTYSNYRFLRRETIQLVRYAIRSVQQRFPGTKPLGLIDMSQRDGVTPGYDVGSPRHPATTHDQGGNVDIAYYTTLASSGTLSYNQARVICDSSGGSYTTSGFCASSAASTHVVDLPRQVYFMAKLYESPRTRVIGVDSVLAPLLRAEADRQLSLGWITQSARDAFYAKLGSGSGWPSHHHHIHLSLHYWGSSKPGQPGGVPEVEGCGASVDLEPTKADAAPPGKP